MATDATPQPGAVLGGKYRVERVLGSGGMGIVVLATHLRMAKLVAIKLLQPECRDRPDVVVRFAREARAASQLRGEHAVRILDVDDGDRGEPFLVMEYLEGRDLQELLAAEGRLPVARAVSYALQACEGVAEAHACGVIHRDLKPANLFLTTRADGSPLVKILDFGISKATQPENVGDFLVTKPLSAIGSPSYMSPEQLKDAGEVDVGTDIWSLGVVLYQLLTDTLPFEATTTAALAARIAADPPRPLRATAPDVPEELERIVLRCLEKSSANRFTDVTELARALAPFAPGGESGASRIARVVETSAQRATSPRKGATPVPSSEQRPVTRGPATGSIHGASVSPLQRALITDDGSSVVANAEPPAPPRRSRWPAYVLAAAALAGLALAGRFVLQGRGAPAPIASGPSPIGAAPSAPLPASEVAEASTMQSSGAGGPAHVDASTTATAPAPAGASARPSLPARKPPPARTPAATPSAKNPMDIDFR